MPTTYPYLVVPGSATLQLPGPSGGMVREAITGPSVTTLANGGEAMVFPLNPSPDRITLPYTTLPNTGTVSLFRALRDGVFGRTFVYVDPSPDFLNVLGVDVSTMGVRPGAPSGWVASGGSLAEVATGSPVTGSGVLAWTTAASATLQPGTVANTADATRAPVYLPGEAVTVSLYAKASAAGSATLQLVGYNAAGAVVGTPATAAMALTTSMQRFTVSIAAGAAGFTSALYVLPRIVLTGTPPATVSIAAAQLEYSASVSPWQMGARAPRVQISGVPSWAADKWDGYATTTLVLSEAYV